MSASILARRSTFESSGYQADLWTLINQDAASLDLSPCASQFAALSTARKTEVISRVAKAADTVVSVSLNGLGLDNTHSHALCAILRRPNLTKASFEANNLTEAGLLELAEALLALEGNSYLSELSVGNQRTAISTCAAGALRTEHGVPLLRHGSFSNSTLSRPCPQHCNFTAARCHGNPA